MSEHRLPEPDRPWVMRTYAGHSDAGRSNELYRRNLAKGQTGLSVAFDLPTQTGYDPDHVLARGEVGKVGVSIAHKGDMHTLLDGIPLDEMNTSMTINATAAWLLGALRHRRRRERGRALPALKGTTQNDIIKEYLSRGTYAFPPGPSMRLIADTVAFTVNEIPSWNPTNVCSLPPPGGRRDAGAGDRLRALDRDRRPRRGHARAARSPRRTSRRSSAGSRSSSTPASASSRSTRSCARWPRSGSGSVASATASPSRSSCACATASRSTRLGLTEAQPENNVQRIVLEALAVTLGRNARARAIQLPAWNEAMGLPRPWDQQWSLRIQQMLAFETDLLEYPDIFEGSKVMDGPRRRAGRGRQRGDEGRRRPGRRRRGGRLHEGAPGRVAPRADRADRARRDQGDRPELLHRDRGLAAHRRRRRRHPHPRPRGRARAPRGARAVEGRARPGGGRGRRSRELAEVAADESQNIMPATIEAAKAGATTGEWAQTLRDVFGDYRAPTGVSGSAAGGDEELLDAVRERVDGARRADRPPAADPGRQARPRRPLQRRRADRRPRPRRRHGGDLPGDPPDAASRSPPRRSTRTSTWSASRSSRARTSS